MAMASAGHVHSSSKLSQRAQEEARQAVASKEEDRIAEAFGQIDTDGSGTISGSELADLCALLDGTFSSSKMIASALVGTFSGLNGSTCTFSVGISSGRIISTAYVLRFLVVRAKKASPDEGKEAKTTIKETGKRVKTNKMTKMSQNNTPPQPKTIKQCSKTIKNQS